MNGSSKFHIFLIFILSLDSKCVSHLAHEQNKKMLKEIGKHEEGWENTSMGLP
jgi:hypothetical protein